MRPAVVPDFYPEEWFVDENKIDDLGMWMVYTSVGGPDITNTKTGLPVPYREHAGLILVHICPKAPEGYEIGSLTFDVPETKTVDNRAKWTVDSWEPLSISPSVQHNFVINGQKVADTCPLGHGFIKQGKWVRG